MPTIAVSGAMLTDTAQLSQGKRVAVSHFTGADMVVQLVDFTWSDPTTNGGYHKVVWNWYKDGRLVSRSGNSPQHSSLYLFETTPWTLRTGRDAAALGAGHFKVETVVDDRLVASSQFDIVD